jgi:transcriptional regulator with XRE-family HTH domain
MQYASDVGLRVSELRLKRNISQAALARAIGVSATAISKLESGETRMLRADHLLRIAAELGGDPAALVFGEDSDEYRKIAGASPDVSMARFATLQVRQRRLLARIIDVFFEEDGQQPDEAR